MIPFPVSPEIPSRYPLACRRNFISLSQDVYAEGADDENHHEHHHEDAHRVVQGPLIASSVRSFVEVHTIYNSRLGA